MGKTSFLCRSSRAITCGFSLVHVQLFNDRTSAHSREGFRTLRFTLCKIVRSTACNGSLCGLLTIAQCYNAVTVRLRCPESAGGSYDPITTRWPIPLQNTHAYDPWTQLEFRALICVIRKKSRWAPTSTRGPALIAWARDLAYARGTRSMYVSPPRPSRHHFSNTQRLTQNVVRRYSNSQPLIKELILQQSDQALTANGAESSCDQFRPGRLDRQRHI